MYPHFESSWLAGKESPSTPGTAATSFTGIPTGVLGTDNKFTPLEDMNLRNSNTKVFDFQLGPRWGELTIPESPAYGDTIGIPLLGMLGDYYSTGTAGTPTWTTSGAIVPGAGPVAVTSGSTAASGTFIQIGTTTTSEVVKVGAGSTATSIVIDASTPIRFNHLSGITITTVTGPYTHNFSLLNMNSSTGNTGAQPPTYTLLHRNGVAGSGNNNADQYLYSHFSALKLNMKKDGFFSWDGKATAFARNFPASDILPSFTGVKGIPSWKSAITLAAGAVYNITDLTVDLMRDLDVINTGDGVQDPYAIGAGPLAATFSMDFDAISDESILNYVFNNTQPALQYQLSNGLSGTNLITITISAALAGFKGAPLTPMKTLFGWKATGDLIANTSNAGNSGGYSPLAVTLVNNVPTF